MLYDIAAILHVLNSLRHDFASRVGNDNGCMVACGLFAGFDDLVHRETFFLNYRKRKAPVEATP